MPRKTKTQKYVVFDDLAFCLTRNPVVVPLPAGVTSDKAIRAFIMKTPEKLMRVDCFDWYHGIADVVLDGYTLRLDRVYPNFST